MRFKHGNNDERLRLVVKINYLLYPCLGQGNWEARLGYNLYASPFFNIDFFSDDTKIVAFV